MTVILSPKHFSCFCGSYNFRFHQEVLFLNPSSSVTWLIFHGFKHKMLSDDPKHCPLIVTSLAALTGQTRAQIPLLLPPQGKLNTLTAAATEQIIHQIVKQQQQQQQQIISAHTSQPTIITAGAQGQTLAPVVAKVSLTTVPHTSHIQTLSAATGTPITVTQVRACVNNISL